MADHLDRDAWERRWAEVLREHGDAVAGRPPNEHLLGLAGSLPAPGAALDAGCGHGAESIWLAGLGWRVTAVDFAQPALDRGRATAEALGTEVAARIEWVQGDLGTWVPPTGRFDLVLSLYVHIAGSVPEAVGRLAAAVAPGGSLLVVGHLPVDPDTGEATPAAGQVQASIADVVGVVGGAGWQVLLAEDRVRPQAGSGVDAVVLARRA
jgi:SAM-dependent methyltransferase